MTDSSRARAEAFRGRPVRCAIITVSDSLDEETDRCGTLLFKRLRRAGHHTALRKVFPDRPSILKRGVEELAGKVDVAFFCDATQAGWRTRPATVLAGTLERPLPGFGELFRARVYQRHGPRAMLSRVSAGTTGGTLFFALPGTIEAVRLALDDLILPDLRHLVWETVRGPAQADEATAA